MLELDADHSKINFIQNCLVAFKKGEFERPKSSLDLKAALIRNTYSVEF
jgi:hypothetical protein